MSGYNSDGVQPNPTPSPPKPPQNSSGSMWGALGTILVVVVIGGKLFLAYEKAQRNMPPPRQPVQMTPQQMQSFQNIMNEAQRRAKEREAQAAQEAQPEAKSESPSESQ